MKIEISYNALNCNYPYGAHVDEYDNGDILEHEVHQQGVIEQWCRICSMMRLWLDFIHGGLEQKPTGLCSY